MSNEVSNSSIKNNLHQVTYQDLIIFKEDWLKELRNYKSKISNSVNIEFEKYSGLLEKSNQNLNYYEKDKSLFMSKIDFVQEKEKLFTEVINKTNELRNEVMVNQLHISNCRRDIDNSCYKYDKAIADNLLVPGIIGKSCRFQNLKEYITYNKDEMNNAFSGNRQNATELNLLKRKVETNTGQLDTKIKSLEYRLSNFIATRYHELDDKFDRLYEELNKRMNSLLHDVNSNIEERKNELARLKNFVFEENTKNIESVKGIKNDLINEFGEIKKNFKKIKKNIVSLTNLLMGRTQNMNRQFVITNFNNMMLELFREFSLEEGFEIKKTDSILPAKTFRKSVKPSGESFIKQYIEGKISANDPKFLGEKGSIKRKKSFQLNDKMLLGFNKEEAQHTVAASNNNINKIIAESPKVNKSFRSRLTQVITFNPNILEKHNKGFTEPKKKKKEDKIIANKDVRLFKIESFNNTIMSKNKSKSKINYSNKNKNADNNEVIHEEDSNKYNSSKSINNSFEIKNENRKSSFNIVKQKGVNLTPRPKIVKKNISLKVENNNFNIYSSLKDNKIIEFSENSSSSLKLENSTEIKDKNYFINSPNNSKPKTAYKKSLSKYHKYSDELSYNNEYKGNEPIFENNIVIVDTISKDIRDTKIKNKEEENESVTSKNIQNIENEKNNEYDTNLSKNNYTIQNAGKFKIIKNETKDKDTNENKEEVKQNNLNIKDNKKKQLTLVLKSENTENFNIIDKVNINKTVSNDFRNSFTQLIRKDKDDKISSFNKITMSTKLNLKKCLDSTKIMNSNDNNFNNLMSKTKYSKFKSTSDKAVTTIPRINSPNVIRSLKNKEDNKVTISSNGDNLINTKYSINAPKTIFKDLKRNHILNNMEERGQLTSFEKQKITSNKNKYFNNNEIRQKLKSSSKPKQSKLKVNEDLDDIFLSKDYIKSTRYVKDEEIIDRPLLLDMNVFNVEKKKGNLENRLMELEYFTKKKLDELVKEIKIFIPIHFNSYIKNYSVNKKN